MSECTNRKGKARVDESECVNDHHNRCVCGGERSAPRPARGAARWRQLLFVSSY